LERLSLVPDREPEEFLAEYRCEWYCYWDNSYGPPPDPTTNYAFKPPLGQSRDGLVAAKDWDLLSQGATEEDALTAASALLDMRAHLDEAGVRCSAYGSESDYAFLPILMPFPSAEALTAQAVLHILGAHQQLLGSVRDVTDQVSWCLEDTGEASGNEEEEEEEDQQLFETRESTRAVHQLLTGRSGTLPGPGGQPPLVFYAGSERLNPVPFFVLGRMASGLVGGFMSVLIHT